MKYRVYGGVWYRLWLWRKVARQHMRPMDVQHVPRGIIVNEHVHGFGIFDSRFKFMRSSRQVRGNNGQFVPKFDRKNIPYVDEDVVFIGNVMPQFGHFLLEHMNRAYALLRPAYRDMRFVLINNDGVKNIPEYMYDLISMTPAGRVGKDQVLIVDRTTQFRNVYIPRQGYNLPVWSSSEFGATFDSIAENLDIPVGTDEKIYVSRSRLGARRTYGEEKVQRIFEKNGYKIIYPETMSMTQQIAAVRGAKCLAGCAGTALHLALFMRPGGRVIQIKRNRKNKDNAPTQHLINTTIGLSGVFINASIETYRSDHGTNGPQIIGVNKNLRRFFDDEGFVYDAEDIAPDTESMSAYGAAAAEHRRKYGGGFKVFLKHKLVRYSACLIPGRERRGRWRRWLSARILMD